MILAEACWEATDTWSLPCLPACLPTCPCCECATRIWDGKRVACFFFLGLNFPLHSLESSTPEATRYADVGDPLPPSP